MSAKMDPQDPASFTHKFSRVNGIRYHYVDEGTGPVLFLCHGFPDLWFGWRYQIPYLVKKGYRVIVPDLRGFGDTDSPKAAPGDDEALKQYGFKNLCKDMAELLDHVAGKGSKATFIGHDWGAALVWRMCLWYPERVLNVAAICVPYAPPNDEFVSIEQLVKLRPQFKYQIWFKQPSTDAVLDAHTSLILRSVYRGAGEMSLIVMPSIDKLPKDIRLSPKLKMSPKDMEYYVQQYKKSGFHGPLNFYRTRKINFEDEKGLPKDLKLNAMLVYASDDPAFPEKQIKTTSPNIKNFETHRVEAGHFVQVEGTDHLNAILGDWLDRAYSSKQSKL
ncbi:Alpha/Beta hydrolase protein [Fimicolochytrium jonesii]|uniref:Alpha/Beta hydrolase protein n=1 Tax=Fimicolochytrium jonesii TaxID=1396493 RepID=UPI0022FE23FE|nr:Alpha/Beta hydrolase protein [Fimicolochytrium jonesii]KAI8820633.1 Alpha/Beta hydrolase protein [Fimicolochytrium jonesii]